VIEFIVVGLCVLVPLLYVALAAAGVQRAALASTQAVREAGRAFSSAATPAQGRSRAASAARLAFADQGLVLPPDALRLTCSGGPCLSPGSVVDVQVLWTVPLPWVPASLADGSAPGIPIRAAGHVPIDDYRGDPEAAS
jgi:hypothetical protein